MTIINVKLHAIALAVTALCLGSDVSARQASPAPAVKAPLNVSLDKPLWQELSHPQQVALEPLKGEWNAMEGLRKQKWLELANRYASMKPDEQARVQERMRAWVKMTPQERRVVRENYTLSKTLDKGQKSAKWEQYQQLPEAEKRKLAAEAAAKKSAAQAPAKGVTPVKPAAPVTNPPPVIPAAPVPNVK